MWVASPDLLQLVVEPLTQQYIVVLEGTWYDGVEIKVTIHISRHKTIMRLQELANLDFGKGLVAVVEWDKHALSLLILMILDVHCSIIGCSCSALLL